MHDESPTAITAASKMDKATVNLPKSVPLSVAVGRRRQEDSEGRVLRPEARLLPLKMYLLLAEFGEQIYLTGMVSSGASQETSMGQAGNVALADHPLRSFRQLCDDIGRKGLDIHFSTVIRAFKILRKFIEEDSAEYERLQASPNPREVLADYLFGKIHNFPHWRSRPGAMAVVRHGISVLGDAEASEASQAGKKKRRGQRGKDKRPRQTAQRKPADENSEPPAQGGGLEPPVDRLAALQGSTLFEMVAREAANNPPGRTKGSK